MDVHPLDAASDRPPYEQLRVQLASRAATGDLTPGTRLPTVRALATELHLAVNTVARAYRELEADGVVVSERLRGRRHRRGHRRGGGVRRVRPAPGSRPPGGRSPGRAGLVLPGLTGTLWTTVPECPRRLPAWKPDPTEAR